LRSFLDPLSAEAGFTYQVAVLPISVAALATTRWIAGHMPPPGDVDCVYVPGLCQGDIAELESLWQKPVLHGPNDYRDLAETFGRGNCSVTDYGAYDIQIIAEINDAAGLSKRDLVAEALRLRDAGADIIDVGCRPAGPWVGVGDAVASLVENGLRVSIDSLDIREIEPAVRAGAELVLSVNGSNREAARDWGVEVVAIPDEPATLAGFDETIDWLAKWNVPFRLDPIVNPIGLGFAESLGRYLDVRRRYPKAAMLMGVGNLTEMTDVDSSGVNVLLLGFCEELAIRSVLTTQVGNWCRSAVAELALARRLVHYAVSRQTPAKRLEPKLLLLRDPRLRVLGDRDLRELHGRIKDPNFRIFAERGQIHLFNQAHYFSDSDPFVLLRRLLDQRPVDAAHAFYLGYEMAKAATALTLGKNYVQDQPLHWGFLNKPEPGGHATICKSTESNDADLR
jgi:dihydropteroate synthase-like protein